MADENLISEKCKLGTTSHEAHDKFINEISGQNIELFESERVCKKVNESQRKSIAELEAFKKYAEMTPRILSERIIWLERALKVLSNRYVKMGGKI